MDLEMIGSYIFGHTISGAVWMFPKQFRMVRAHFGVCMCNAKIRQKQYISNNIYISINKLLVILGCMIQVEILPSLAMLTPHPRSSHHSKPHHAGGPRLFDVEDQ